MDKLKMHSPNLTEDNIARIREMFPGCVTEAQCDDGTVKLAVDFDQLKQELSGSIVEGPQERYHLNWPGKREALLTANAPIAKTLRPVRAESVDFDTTKNLFIEGDNLDALKLLQETYLGKVKMIYIDPPYNTGNDFLYDDDFASTHTDFLISSNQISNEGDKLVANNDSNGRFHSDWISMMYVRLKIAKNLLANDGVVLISIDDVEVANLYKICEEIFGSSNFLGNFIWKSRQTTDSRKQTRVSSDHEYLLCFAKEIDSAYFAGKDIDKDKYQNPDNDPRGPWASIDLTVQETKETRPNHFFDIVDPKTGISYPANPKRVWSKGRSVIEKMLSENRILFPSTPDGRPREKKFLNEISSTKTGFSTILDSNQVGFTRDGTKALARHFEDKIFTFPKSPKLLEIFLGQLTQKDSLVLDMFAGSATMAEAIFRYNSSTGSNLRCISIQIDEAIEGPADSKFKAISDFSKERIRRAGKRIISESANMDWSNDIGFRVFKIDTSNMADVYYAPDALDKAKLDLFVDNIKTDRTPDDLLFQVMLDWGVDLALPIAKQSIQGKDVFFVDDNALAACFDANSGVDETFVKELAKRQPLRVVFRDAGFKDSAVKINVEQIFKLLSPATEVKCI